MLPRVTWGSSYIVWLLSGGSFGLSGTLGVLSVWVSGPCHSNSQINNASPLLSCWVRHLGLFIVSPLGRVGGSGVGLFVKRVRAFYEFDQIVDSFECAR